MTTAHSHHEFGLYLTDHHAGSVAATALARHCRERNESNETGAYLRDTFIPELESERATLEGIMAGVGAKVHPIKDAFAWFGAQVERFKPNGSLISYSPLSRVVELETLMVGVRGKRAGWTAMKSIAPGMAALRDVDFDRLIALAERQETTLDQLRTQAAQLAFA